MSTECRGCALNLLDANAHDKSCPRAVYAHRPSPVFKKWVNVAWEGTAEELRALAAEETEARKRLMPNTEKCRSCQHPAEWHTPGTGGGCGVTNGNCLCVVPPGWLEGLKDSGERVTHTTGAVRDSAVGRGRYDLISPIMMKRLAVHLERGAEKYEERNWEKGLPIGRMFASLFRHSWQAFAGETDEDHLAAVICNAMFIMHTLEMIARGRLPASLNDLPDYRSGPEERD
jgi:hypothetical protein